MITASISARDVSGRIRPLGARWRTGAGQVWLPSRSSRTTNRSRKPVRMHPEVPASRPKDEGGSRGEGASRPNLTGSRRTAATRPWWHSNTPPWRACWDSVRGSSNVLRGWMVMLPLPSRPYRGEGICRSPGSGRVGRRWRRGRERRLDGMDGSLRQAIVASHGDHSSVDQQSNTPRLLPRSRSLAMRNAGTPSEYRNNRWNSSRFRLRRHRSCRPLAATRPFIINSPSKGRP